MKKYFPELIGTAALVLVGCGSAFIAGSHFSYAGIAFAFGLTVLVMVYAIGPISGCHVNLAITVAMWLVNKIKGKGAIFYINAHCIGAIIGAGLLWAIARGLPGYTLAVNGLGQNGQGAHSPADYSLLSYFIFEIVSTVLFLFMIFGATHRYAPKGFAGMVIGFTLVLIHLVGIPVDGTSVNPARSLGPAVFVGGAAISQVRFFIVGSIVGGVIAAIIWKHCFEGKAAQPAK
jgi:aquaporin Z